jgi:excisionase family DNA binding protein
MENIMMLEGAAKYLKMKPQTIWLWAQKGNIPAIKLGKEWRFLRGVIDEWLNQRFDKKFNPIINNLDGRK